MAYQKCETGGGRYVAPVCRFNTNNVRGFTAIRAGAPNPWTGANAAAQKTNMADQALWTAGLTAPLPDNLYLSPRCDLFELPKAFDTVQNFGHSKVSITTGKAEVEFSLTFAGVTQEEYDELNKWNDSSMLFQFVDDTGVIGHKEVSDGVEYPFFKSSGVCSVSSYNKASDGVGSVDILIRSERDWFAYFDSTGVDVTAITQIQDLLSNK